MWDIPWLVTLLVAGAAGSTGFLLWVVMAVGQEADSASEEMRRVEVKGDR